MIYTQVKMHDYKYICTYEIYIHMSTKEVCNKFSYWFWTVTIECDIFTRFSNVEFTNYVVVSSKYGGIKQQLCWVYYDLFAVVIAASICLW